jgi:hypothetical protein
MELPQQLNPFPQPSAPEGTPLGAGTYNLAQNYCAGGGSLVAFSRPRKDPFRGHCVLINPRRT